MKAAALVAAVPVVCVTLGQPSTIGNGPGMTLGLALTAGLLVRPTSDRDVIGLWGEEWRAERWLTVATGGETGDFSGFCGAESVGAWYSAKQLATHKATQANRDNRRN